MALISFIAVIAATCEGREQLTDPGKALGSWDSDYENELESGIWPVQSLLNNFRT